MLGPAWTVRRFSGTFPRMPCAKRQWVSERLNDHFLYRFSVQAGGVSGPLMAAEEAYGPGLRAGVSASYDGGPEATGAGPESGWGRRRRLPLPADSKAPTAGGGAAGPQQHAGNSWSGSEVKCILFYKTFSVDFFKFNTKINTRSESVLRCTCNTTLNHTAEQRVQHVSV